jgi:hypothetical protein
MSTAVTPVNASAPLQFHWDADNVNDKYYVFIHLYDFEKRAANETRAFNITVKGYMDPADQPIDPGPMVLMYGEGYTIPTISPLHVDRATRYQLTLSKTENSTLPPILNAIELYKLINFSQSETDQDDGKRALYFI